MEAASSLNFAKAQSHAAHDSSPLQPERQSAIIWCQELHFKDVGNYINTKVNGIKQLSQDYHETVGTLLLRILRWIKHLPLVDDAFYIINREVLTKISFRAFSVSIQDILQRCEAKPTAVSLMLQYQQTANRRGFYVSLRLATRNWYGVFHAFTIHAM